MKVRLFYVVFIVVSLLYVDFLSSQVYSEDDDKWIQVFFWGGFLAVLTLGLTKTKFSFTNESELSKKHPILYLLSESEKNTFKKINSNEQRKIFIDNFWNRYPNGMKEKLRSEFNSRVDFANREFKELNLEGWQTDRGRVLIFYGHPFQKERIDFGKNFTLTKFYNYSDPENQFVDKRYEVKTAVIWTYDRPAGPNPIPFNNQVGIISPNMMTFVFAEKNNYGEYVQIFSTESGEVIDAKLYEE